jgi:threonine aldolase
MTARLEEGLKSIPGTRLAGTPQANILFCRLPQQVIDGLLDQGYSFYHDRWEPGVVRFVTSFATTTHDVDELVHAVRRLTAIEESRSKRVRTQRSASDAGTTGTRARSTESLAKQLISPHAMHPMTVSPRPTGR